MTTLTDRRTSVTTANIVGLAAVTFSVMYFASDVWEAVSGGFTRPQLLLTYVAEAAIPVFVLGLYAVQRPRIGTLGLAGAIGYAYAYVYFAGTVMIAIVDRPADWDTLASDLGPWVTVHGALMVVAGCAFGVAALRAGVFPRWTAWMLMAGVVLVALAEVMPAAAQTVSAGVRDLGFAGMGAFLLRAPRSTGAEQGLDGGDGTS